ncbi:MAG: AAA family ATPase, partial [Selenomonadaceae bacterium]|nr:AAA family ATPase [Selenomonadaceae bacterium]
SQVTLITRPRRFGKTLTLSMLYYFFTNENPKENRCLFKDCHIATVPGNYMNEQGTRPVVLLTLKDIQANSFQEMLALLSALLHDLYENFRFLLDSDALTPEEKTIFQKILAQNAQGADLQFALQRLTKYLHRHYSRQVLLLIDEYDAPIQTAWEHDYYDEAIVFMRNFLSSALKSNPSLDFSLLTGVLRIAKESIFSALNNLEVSSIVQGRFADAMGFTFEEVKEMAECLGRSDKLCEIQDWYDGYSFSGTEIYNPWSVIYYFLQNCTPGPYWLNTSGNAIIGELLKRKDESDETRLLALLHKTPISITLEEGMIYPEIFENKDALYTMLLTTGYLKPVHAAMEDGEWICDLAIPNKEIQTIYRKEILNRYRRHLANSDLRNILKYLLEGKSKEFSAGLEKYLRQIISFYDTATGENFYHGLMLGLTAWLMPAYQVKSNGESGEGRFDLAFFPLRGQKHGILMEFKIAKRKNSWKKKQKRLSIKSRAKAIHRNSRAETSPIYGNTGLLFAEKRCGYKHPCCNSCFFLPFCLFSQEEQLPVP